MDNNNKQRIQELYELWNESTNDLMHNKKALTEFFRFSSKMYKVSFPDALLVYEQNPNAAKVADVRTWNKFGRYVYKGVKGIAVFEDNHRCRYLFDESQTHGYKKAPEIWKLNEQTVNDLLAALNQNENKEYMSLDEAIFDISKQTIKDHFELVETAMNKRGLEVDEGKRFYNSVVSAVNFIICSRCELNSDDNIKFNADIDLSAADDFTSNKDLIYFCDFIQKCAKHSLLLLERDIIRIQKNYKEENQYENERTELQNQRSRSAGASDSIYHGPERNGIVGEAHRQMGQSLAEVDGNRISTGQNLSDNEMSLEHNSERGRYRSGETLGRAGRDLPQAEPASDNLQRNSSLGERTFNDTGKTGNDGSSIYSERIESNLFLKETDLSRWTAGEKLNLSEKEDTLILNNESVVRSDLLPVTDEKIICDTLTRGKLPLKDEISEFFANHDNRDERIEYVKSLFANSAIQFENTGYRATENGLQMWRGKNYINRTHESGLSWELVQNFIAEAVSDDIYSSADEIQQFSLFGEPVPLSETVSVKPKKQAVVNKPQFEITQEMIDYVIKTGSTQPYSHLRICDFFSKNKTTEENIEFLQKEFGVDGRGVKYPLDDKSAPALLSVWYDKNGITIGAGITALDAESKVQLPWEQVSDRIKNLLEHGEFTNQDNIDGAKAFEIKKISESLWYLHQDHESDLIDYFIPDNFFSGGFPASTERIAEALRDEKNLSDFIDGLTDFVKKYEQNRDILRFHFHKPQELLTGLKDLQIERVRFAAKQDFDFKPKYFITEDEKDRLLISGSVVQDGKFRINEFFQQPNTTADEKIKFLKNEYGIGGRSQQGYDEWHDAKGIVYQKGLAFDNPDAKTVLNWHEVSQRIERLVNENKYITEKDIENRIRNAKYVIDNVNSDSQYDIQRIREAKQILHEYGIDKTDISDIPDNLDKFYVNRDTESVTWVYFNPDSSSGGQLVYNYFTFDTLQKALQSDNPLDELSSVGSITLSDFGTPDFENDLHHFLEDREDFNNQKNTVLTELKALVKDREINQNSEISESVKEESPIHFGLFGNGVTAYDVSRTNPKTNDYVTVAHISPEGVVKICDDSIAPDDMDRINSEAESLREKFKKTEKLTNAEKSFLDTDIASLMAKSVLAWDEIEDIGYRLFEKGYMDKFGPSENAVYGNGLSDKELYSIAKRMQNGEDIKKELATALIGKQSRFVSKNGNEFNVQYGDNDITAHFGNAEKKISYAELGEAFITLARNEHDDIVREREEEKNAILISDDDIRNVIHRNYAKLPDDIKDKAKKALIVNLYGGPGAGKSTTALQLVAELKKRGLHAEYVSEVAKELVYAKAFDKLDGSLVNQKNIFAEQKNRLDMIAGNVDVAVTDSPLMLNTVYLKEQNEEYLSSILSQYHEYNNFNILISRDTSVPFENEGRIHNLNESMEKDGEIFSLLERNNIEFEKFDRDNITEIVDNIISKYDIGEVSTEKEETSEYLGNTVEQTETQKKKPEKVPKSNVLTGAPLNYRYKDISDIGGAKSKYKANVEAIKTLIRIEEEHRYATAEEQEVMAKYTGWGGIPQAFDSANTSWTNEYNELINLLTEKEYKAARASALTSFYTPAEVADGIYQALNQFGFNGGNILEPSIGIGNFFAKMPEEMFEKSSLYGVELDSVSGRIAKQLYPSANIQIKGFEQTKYSSNSFDVVIGNVPFGDYRVSDKAYDKYGFKIHDYFAAKAVDKVKPGGIVAIVTSKFTMDKQNNKARRYLAERCGLLGAVRLPNKSFDGTDIPTDILFLQKRETMTAEIPDWVHMSVTADGIPCNKYFVNNPEMMLGTMAWDKQMRGKYGEGSKVTACYANTDTPLSEQLKTAISKIQGGIKTVEQAENKEEKRETIPADPSVRNFTHTIVGGNLYFRENEIMIKVTETGRVLDRMMGMHQIRQSAMALIYAQSEGCTDEELAALQKDLNIVYDKFQKAYGNINDKVNERCFSNDDDYNTIAALEVPDEENKTVTKAEIFFKRTIKPEVQITSVDTADEALQVSLDRLGKVDIKYMSDLTGAAPEQVIEDLSRNNQIFRNPVKIKDNDSLSGYEDASEYLSGNVRKKLSIAKRYAENDENFIRNAEALIAVIPKDLDASEIAVRIGANWIDLEDYNLFLKEFAHADTDYHPVERTCIGEYKIQGKYQDKSIAAAETYGTKRMSSYHIFENLLNQRNIVIRDRNEDSEGKVTYVINTEDTRIAKEKARKMAEGFKTWLWTDLARRKKYVKKYNDMFNAIKGREYDGSNQSFPGMNPHIQLRKHQADAIMRAKLSGNTLLAHCVGAGKSFEMVASTMEKKRLGLINKACVVVPKHLTLQTASEWIRLYPNAKLLVARPEDFTKDNRRKFIARCVTGEYDAVIMSFTQFERIPMSDEYRQRFMENELDSILNALAETDEEDRISVKILERQKIKLEQKIKKLIDSPKDNSLCFEKLGFDYLVCDEAHNYKNCFVATKMSNVAGVQTTAAQKSEDMLMKTEYLNNKYGCNNILFATGTPVSNSMSELYIMQRYLRPDLLRDLNVNLFDDWAGTFGEVVTQLEMKPAGDGYRLKSRFSKFVNIPELMQMYKEFADIQTADMIKLPVPKLKTGEPIVITAKPDERQKAYMKELAARSEAIHNGAVDPNTDNMLKITHEARLLGLDSRCIFRNAEPAPDSKVMKLIDNLEKNYHETMEQKGVQIIFCDIAVNEDAEHFSVYEAIKTDLIKRGIPREEICFAGDAHTDKARSEMYEQLRQGEKRFIIASTSKLGTGANIQDRICAIHHLDIPWRPADLIQQDGRGIRRGNMFEEVGIYYYLTEGTFDAYMMGIITSKVKYINQIMTSKDPIRVSEDVDEMVLTYSQMQAAATGNPMIMEKIQLDNDIASLKTLKAEHSRSVYKLQELAEKTLPDSIKNYASLLEKANADYKVCKERKSQEFSMQIDGVIYTERAKAGDKIEEAIMRCCASEENIKIGSYSGIDLWVEKNPANTEFFTSGSPCAAVLHGQLKYSCEINLNNNVGNIRRIENLAGTQITQKIHDLKNNLEKSKADLEEALINVQQPFEHEKELEEKLKRIEIVNQQLSGIEPVKTVTSEIYENQDGEMLDIREINAHSAVTQNLSANNENEKFNVLEEPYMHDSTVEYRDKKDFPNVQKAKEYAKSLENNLSEKKNTDYMSIGKKIDTALINSQAAPKKYDITGAINKLKSDFSSDEIKACTALSILCRADSPKTDETLKSWAEEYIAEHGIDTKDLSFNKSPCKCHIAFLNAFAKKLNNADNNNSRTIDDNTPDDLYEGYSRGR